MFFCKQDAISVFLLSLALLCPLTSAERGEDTALQFDGRGLNAFKRLDGASKVETEDAYYATEAEYAAAHREAERARDVKPHRHNDATDAKASLVELASPEVTDENAKKLIADVVRIQALDKVKDDIKQEAIDGHVATLTNTASTTNGDLKGIDRTRLDAIKAIDAEFKARRTEAAKTALEEVSKKDEDRLKLSKDIFPDTKKDIGERDMLLRYPEFLAAVQTFQPERVKDVQTKSGDMMDKNNDANKASREYSDAMLLLANATGKGYTKMGLNHFYGFDQIRGQIEEGHMVPGKSVQIFFPMNNRIEFQLDAGLLTPDALAFVSGDLKTAIEEKVEKYKGFHFTFCVEASSTISKAANRNPDRMGTAGNIAHNASSGNLKQSAVGQTNRDLVDLRMEHVQTAVDEMLRNNVAKDKNLDASHFDVFKSDKSDRHYQCDRRKDACGTPGLTGAEGPHDCTCEGAGKTQPLGAVLMIAEDASHRDHPDTFRKNCNNEKGVQDFDALAANAETMERVHDINANSGTREDGIIIPEAQKSDPPESISQSEFRTKFEAMLLTEMEAAKTKKFASVSDCYDEVADRAKTETGKNWLGKEACTGATCPDDSFRKYMDEQLAYVCNIISDLHNVKDVPIKVADEPAKPPEQP